MDFEIHQEQSASEAVIEAVSVAEGISEGSLPPITESVPSDDFDSMCAPDKAEPPCTCQITFAYSKSLVQVDNGEYITVEAV